MGKDKKPKTNYVATVNFFLFVVLVCWICWTAVQFQKNQPRETGLTPSGTTVQRQLPKGVYHLLPSKIQVYAGPMLDSADLVQLVTDYPISTVIRLNLEQKALQRMDTARQRSILAGSGVVLYTFNIEGKDGLNEKILQEIDALMDGGRVYVHCTHGKHRAKAVAGRYYARRGYRSEDIHELLDWQEVVEDPTYWRYVEHVRQQTFKIQSK